MKKKKKAKKKVHKKKVDEIIEEAGSTAQNEESFIPSNIQVLGMDEHNYTILWAKDSRRIWRIPKLREIDGCMLIQIAGQDSLRDSGVELGQIKAAIAQTSRRHCFGPDDHIGQGIWKTPRLGGVLILSGDRAVLVERGQQGITFREIEEPMVNGKLLEFNTVDRWIDLDWLKKAVFKINPDVTKQLWNRLLDCLSCWNFRFKTDRDVVAGMILATQIQGTLAFRPHMWITGATNTGKTALFTLLGRLWPYALRLENETSEAAIRQSIRHSCLPVLFDECEWWYGRRSVIKLLRSSTRSGKVIKGTPSHKPIRFGLRHVFWLAAIETGLRKDVDKNRFIVVELEKSNEIKIPKAEHLEAFGRALVASSITLVDKIKSLYTTIFTTNHSRKWGRFAEALALPAAVKAAFLNVGKEGGEKFLQQFLDDRQEILAEFSEPDYTEILSNIYSATITIEFHDSGLGRQVRKKYSAGDLINNSRGLEELKMCGIRIIGDKSVFFAPQIIQQKLLYKTKWKDANIADILARMPGAERTRRRVAGHNCRGIMLPRASLDIGAERNK